MTAPGDRGDPALETEIQRLADLLGVGDRRHFRGGRAVADEGLLGLRIEEVQGVRVEPRLPGKRMSFKSSGRTPMMTSCPRDAPASERPRSSTGIWKPAPVSIDWPSPPIFTVRKFIAGLPMKPATNRLTGCS